MEVYLYVQKLVLMSKIFGLEKFTDDYISLDSKTLKKDFIIFYSKDFFECCDYCS